jgi:2-polyprenyl-6-methoxyphenol hydroxylase-like FAD-dependent oxidoreductase
MRARRFVRTVARERGGYQIHNGDGELLRAISWNRTAVRLGEHQQVHQPDLEAVLESMALAQPSVELRRGWSAATIDQDEDSVTLTVFCTADHSQHDSLRGRWLVGADGANSVVRELAGIESVDTGFEADWLVVDYQPLDHRQWDAFVTQYWIRSAGDGGQQRPWSGPSVSVERMSDGGRAESTGDRVEVDGAMGCDAQNRTS